MTGASALRRRARSETAGRVPAVQSCRTRRLDGRLGGHASSDLSDLPDTHRLFFAADVRWLVSAEPLCQHFRHLSGHRCGSARHGRIPAARLSLWLSSCVPAHVSTIRSTTSGGPMNTSWIGSSPGPSNGFSSTRSGSQLASGRVVAVTRRRMSHV
jgi:hypothetical protein